MSDDDTTLGDDIREYRRPHAVLAARADALTAALREARAERHDMAIRLGEANRRTNRADAEVERLRPATCDMKHAEPFNFAWCETHDTIFPLGKSCRFDGRDVTEVFGEDADTQRQRAVMAEMERDRLAAQVEAARALAREDRNVSPDYRGDTYDQGWQEGRDDLDREILAALGAGKEE